MALQTKVWGASNECYDHNRKQKKEITALYFSAIRNNHKSKGFNEGVVCKNIKTSENEMSFCL